MDTFYRKSNLPIHSNHFVGISAMELVCNLAMDPAPENMQWNSNEMKIWLEQTHLLIPLLPPHQVQNFDGRLSQQTGLNVDVTTRRLHCASCYIHLSDLLYFTYFRDLMSMFLGVVTIISPLVKETCVMRLGIIGGIKNNWANQVLEGDAILVYRLLRHLVFNNIGQSLSKVLN